MRDIFFLENAGKEAITAKLAGKETYKSTYEYLESITASSAGTGGTEGATCMA